MSNYKMNTKCVQAGYRPGNGEPRQIPIIQSTTFKYDTSEDMGKLFDLEATGYFYTRLQNPTNDMVAAKIAELLNQRNNYLSDFDRQVRALNEEKQSAINKYAMDLYNRDVDYDRQQALAAASRSYSGGGSGGSSSSNDGVSSAMSDLMNDFNRYIKNGDSQNARELLYLGLNSVSKGYLSHQDYNKMQASLQSLEGSRQAKKDKYNTNKTYGYRNGVAGYY